MDRLTNSFYDNVDSLQSEMLAYILDYVRDSNSHPLIRYNRKEDMLYFKTHTDEWKTEYEVDIWLIAEIADSVSAKQILVSMSYDKQYLDCIEYDECNDSLILKLNGKQLGEDECPWALANILDMILFNNKQNN